MIDKEEKQQQNAEQYLFIHFVNLNLFDFFRLNSHREKRSKNHQEQVFTIPLASCQPIFIFIFIFFLLCVCVLYSFDYPHLFKVRKRASVCVRCFFPFSNLYFFGLFLVVAIAMFIISKFNRCWFCDIAAHSINSFMFVFMLICIHINSNHCLCSLFIPFVLSLHSLTSLPISHFVCVRARVYNFNIELYFVKWASVWERETNEIKMVSKNMLEKRKRINNKYIIHNTNNKKKYCLVLMMIVVVESKHTGEHTHTHTLCKKQLMDDLKYRYKIYQLWILGINVCFFWWVWAYWLTTRSLLLLLSAMWFYWWWWWWRPTITMYRKTWMTIWLYFNKHTHAQSYDLDLKVMWNPCTHVRSMAPVQRRTHSHLKSSYTFTAIGELIA